MSGSWRQRPPSTDNSSRWVRGATLGHGLNPYRPRSTEQATPWPLIAPPAQNRHLSLHVYAVVAGEYLAEARAGRLGKVPCGKSCVRFPSLDDVDTGELRSLVHDAVAATAAGDNAYSAT